MNRFTTWLLTGAFALSSINCTTTYDAYGNPRNSVDPGTAMAGVAAAGVLGYALSNNRNRSRYDRHIHYDRSYYDSRDRYYRY